jgi:hypothetical protein
MIAEQNHPAQSQLFAPIGQLAEQVTLKQSPCEGNLLFVAELATDSGS